jgi:hypothetical protein
MRTTVTIDADVAAEIERIRKAQGKRFKQVLNDVLRAGLRQLAGETKPKEWVSPTHSMDLGVPLIDITNASRALDHAEGEWHK